MIFGISDSNCGRVTAALVSSQDIPTSNTLPETSPAPLAISASSTSASKRKKINKNQTGKIDSSSDAALSKQFKSVTNGVLPIPSWQQARE
jgi:hypothetical protein